MHKSVTAAVEGLNDGTIDCEQGICAMYNDSNKRWVLLYRADKKPTAKALFASL